MIQIGAINNKIEIYTIIIIQKLVVSSAVDNSEFESFILNHFLGWIAPASVSSPINLTDE